MSNIERRIRTLEDADRALNKEIRELLHELAELTSPEYVREFLYEFEERRNLCCVRSVENHDE
jgi:hypothetical protein